MQAGTKVKNLFTKITAGEKSAKMLFDNAMINSGVTGESVGLETTGILKFDDISINTMKGGLQESLDILSKLYVEGKLTTAVMQKMFTNRHFMEASHLFLEMAGNSDAFVESIARGISYVADYEKKMFDLNEQVKQFRNLVFATSGDSLGLLKQAQVGILMSVNEQLKEYMTNIDDSTRVTIGMASTVSVGFLSLFTVLKTVSLSLGMINKSALASAGAVGKLGLAFTGLSTGAFVAIAGGIGVVVGLLAHWGKSVYEIKKQSLDLVQNIGKLAIAEKEIEKIKTKQTSINEILNRQGTDIKNGAWEQVFALEETSSLLGIILGKSQSFANVMSSFNKATALNHEDFFKIASTDEMKKYSNEIQELQEQIANAKNAPVQQLRNYSENMRAEIQRVRDMVDTYQTESYKMQYVKTAISLGEKSEKAEGMANILEQAINDGLDFNVLQEKLEEAGFKITDLAKMLGYTAWRDTGTINQMNADYTAILKDQKDLLEKMKVPMEALTKEFSDMQKRLSDYNVFLNALNTEFNTTRESLLNKHGVYYQEKQGGVGFNTITGNKAYEQLIRDEYTNRKKSQEEIYTRGIETATQSLQDFEMALILNKDEFSKYKQLSDKEKSEQYGSLSKDQVDKLLELRKTDENYSKIYDEAQKTIMANSNELKALSPQDPKKATNEAIKMFTDAGIEINKDSYRYLGEIIELILIQNSPKSNDKAIEDAEKLKKIKVIEAKTEYEEGKRKGLKTLVNLDYSNNLKKTLDLELELAKIGETKANQEKLIWQYKKKQLELIDMPIATKELEATTLALRNSQAMGLSKYKQRALQSNTSTELQGVLDSIFANEKTTNRTKEEKGFVDALKNRIKALSEYESVVQELELLPVKTFNEFLEKLPSLNEQILSNFAKQLDLTGYISFDINTQSITNIQSQIDTLLSKDGMSQYLNKDLTQLEKSILETQQKIHDLTKSTNDYNEESVALLIEEEASLQNQLELQTLLLEKQQQQLEIEMKKNELYSQGGSILSELGTVFDSSGLSFLGEATTSLQDLFDVDLSKKFDFSQIFDFDSDNWTKNLSNALSNGFSGLSSGGNIGNMVNQMLGGNTNAGILGSIGGLVGGFGGGKALSSGINSALGTALTGGMGTAILSLGSSLLGGVFGGDSGMSEAEIQQKNAEAENAYNTNTQALQDLSSRMSSLIGTVDNFNKSLIANISKIPTIDKISSAESGLSDMYNLANANRDFGDVAYQYQKKSGGGKKSPDQYYTVTKEMSAEQLARDYYGKSIDSMNTDELRDFSQWLEDFELGEQNNFGDLAESIENYAESLDTLKKNVESQFYDTTMESFEGVSSLDQEELRQQIEDFYNDLGIVIDDSMSAEIDALAESMSVMVTIMEDVRGSFVDGWKEAGDSAGQMLFNSMSPYVTSMLNNVSQIFYDVYYSGVTEELEAEFLNLSESLVELKRQGASLDWDDVVNATATSFDSILHKLNQATIETETFNNVLHALQDVAMNSGLALSEMLDIGLLTTTQESILEAVTSALQMNDAGDALASLGDTVGGMITESLATALTDKHLTDTVLGLSQSIDSAISGGLTFDSLTSLANEALTAGLLLEEQQMRINAIQDMFSFEDIEYDETSSNVEYSSGTSQNLVQNYYISSNLDVGNVIESDDVRTLAKDLLEDMLEILKVDKGINLV